MADVEYIDKTDHHTILALELDRLETDWRRLFHQLQAQNKKLHDDNEKLRTALDHSLEENKVMAEELQTAHDQLSQIGEILLMHAKPQRSHSCKEPVTTTCERAHQAQETSRDVCARTRSLINRQTSRDCRDGIDT